MMRRFPNVIVAAFVVAALLLYWCAFQVRFTETAVVTRIEQPVDREVREGLNFKLPWPFERVYKYDRRLRLYETQFSQLSTEDQKSVTVSVFAAWRIEDARAFLKSVGREEAAETKIGDLLKSAVSRVLKGHPLAHLVNTDPQQIRYRDVEREIHEIVAADARRSYGVQIVNLGIARLGLPEKNTQAVAERMKAERKAVSDRLLAEGEAEAKRITESATAVAEKIKQRAQQYARTIRGEGEALAAANLEVFKKNPQLSIFLKQLETLRAVLTSGESTVVLPAREFGPFDELMEMIKASDGGAASGAAQQADQ